MISSFGVSLVLLVVIKICIALLVFESHRVSGLENIYGTATRANGVCVTVFLFSCESYVYIHTFSFIK